MLGQPCELYLQDVERDWPLTILDHDGVPSAWRHASLDHFTRSIELPLEAYGHSTSS
jgi:hypothetical protein